MELWGKRWSTRGGRHPLYSGRTNPTVIHQLSLRNAVLPYLRRGTTAHAAETRTAQNALNQRVVVLLARYHRAPLRYYRKAGAIQRWEGTDLKNYIRGYFRRVGVDAKTRRDSTVSQQRYYRARRGCKKLHPPLTAAHLRN